MIGKAGSFHHIDSSIPIGNDQSGCHLAEQSL
jgi:hypothetical protein